MAGLCFIRDIHMKVRQFTITNSLGNTYDLLPKNGAEGVYYIGASGLGYGTDGTYQRVGTQNVEVEYHYEQKEISGSLVFYSSDPYKLYFEFCRFLTQRPLTIHYCSFDNRWFNIDVNVSKLEKTERTYQNALVASITFKGLGVFYIEPTEITNEASAEDFKTYIYPPSSQWWLNGVLSEEDPESDVIPMPDSYTDPNTYLTDLVAKDTSKIYIYPAKDKYIKSGNVIDATWWVGEQYVINGTVYEDDQGSYPTSQNKFISFTSDSYLESPCKFTIVAATGAIKNPHWYHYCGSELKEEGKYNGTVPAKYRLAIDTTSIPYSISLLNDAGEFISDVYEKCDFSMERFMFISAGENTYAVSHDGTEAVSIVLTPRVEYESV